MKYIPIENLVFRTPLIVAGNNQRYIKKAFSCECDCIVLDLEDGVPFSCKEEARKIIRETLKNKRPGPKPVLVRVNSLETDLTEEDLEGVSCRELRGFVYPKAQTADEIIRFAELLARMENELDLPEGYFKIVSIIETPLAMLNLKEIAFSSPRLIALLLGAEDLLGDMQGHHGPLGRSLHMIRTSMLLAARAASLIPIDTPYIHVKNKKGLKQFIEPARELGYEGMLVISPSQIPIVKEMYTPTQQEIEDAHEMEKIAAEASESGKNVVLKDKLFVSAPTLKGAGNLLKRYRKIERFEKEVNRER